MKTKKVVYAPAKINLCLHVLRKRSDGYHDLAMLMQRIDLYDRIQIERVPGKTVTVDCPGLELAAGEENIVARAVQLLLKHVNVKQGLAVTIEKKIPAAAGMGGGSSNAATVLEALNEMLGLGLPRAELMLLGCRLGADVPFFLFKQTAWATGIGEQLKPWPGVPPVSLVLVNPGIAVSTAEVFQNFVLTDHGTAVRIPRFPVGMSDLVRLLHNDLEVVTCQRHPVITTIKERLAASGARGTLMSGSGPTVFGLFDDSSLAEQAAQAISVETGWWVKVANPL